MASYFAQFVDLVRARYIEVKAPAPPDVSAESWKRDVLSLGEHGQLPCVTWIRDSGTIEPAESTGPHEAASDGVSFSCDYDDLANISVHIQADDDEQADDIRNGILAAARTALQRKSTPGIYDWVTQQPDEAGHVQGGAQLLVQTFRWRLMVPTRVETTVIPETLTNDGVFGETPGC